MGPWRPVTAGSRTEPLPTAQMAVELSAPPRRAKGWMVHTYFDALRCDPAVGLLRRPPYHPTVPTTPEIRQPEIALGGGVFKPPMSPPRVRKIGRGTHIYR